MAENFQGGVCGGNWWDSSIFLGSSPCSSLINHTGSFWWPSLDHHMNMDMMKAATSNSSHDSTGSASDGGGGRSIVLQDVQKPQQYSIDSTLQMMEFCLSSSTSTDENWNQDLLHGSKKSEEKYTQILLQEAAALNSSINYGHQTRIDFPQINKDFPFRQVNQGFSLEQQTYLNSIDSSTQYTATCQEISASFPLNSASDSYSTSSLLQTLFNTDSEPEQSLSDNQTMINYSYSTNSNYMMDSNQFSPPLPNTSPPFPIKKPAHHLQFTKNTCFLNATDASLNNVRESFDLPSIQSELPNLPNLSAEHHKEEVIDLASVARKTRNNESPFKRPRIETPSPLPSFKVRKEKMGDRITALQQLVSPFGKTDTASVLHEATDYIKFLHDQVSVLSNPYTKNGSSPAQFQQVSDKFKHQEKPKQDLKSRGLCLVPMSSTFPVVSETTSDFWTHAFEGNFR